MYWFLAFILLVVLGNPFLVWIGRRVMGARKCRVGIIKARIEKEIIRDMHDRTEAHMLLAIKQGKRKPRA